ncbi:MAG: hypothetical protein ACI9UA_000369 [Pseudoalteromonas tetraodonis]|jgi:hypothetical protein
MMRSLNRTDFLKALDYLFPRFIKAAKTMRRLEARAHTAENILSSPPGIYDYQKIC